MRELRFGVWGWHADDADTERFAQITDGRSSDDTNKRTKNHSCIFASFDDEMCSFSCSPSLQTLRLRVSA